MPLWGVCDAPRVNYLSKYGCSRLSSKGETVEIKKVVIREEERTNRKPAVMEKRPPSR
ncbi:hypothetical protein GCM10009612_36810 [Streptomyces beijiangensis]